VGTVNVKKPGSTEPDIWVRLYRIEPRRSARTVTT